MPFWKRATDILLSTGLLLVFMPVFISVMLIMTIRRDLPVFYVSERMRSAQEDFPLIKFRTMRPAGPDDPDDGASGGHKADRITPMGIFLRGKRLDELPQLWNVLRGDISLVGPRPPLRRYTEMFPDLYTTVLQTPPGITGLASLIYHKTEARLLAGAKTAEETEEIYTSRCVPHKARIDRIYYDNRSIRLDLYILYLTAAKILPLPGRRAKRIR